MNTAGGRTQSRFARIPSVNNERSVFDRTSTHKTTFNEGDLIPYYVEEVLPGDTMSLRSSVFVRLNTPIVPYMDSLFADVHFFFVPNRLVWVNWEKFNGAQDNPGDSTDFLVPQLDAATHAAGFTEGSVHDYLGLPTKVAGIPQARMPNALVHRSLNLIWNTWYRDENLQNSLPVPTGNGPDNTAYAIQKRNRRKDYFTSCLTAPQKGPSVLLPLGTSAPVKGIGIESPVGAWFATAGQAVRETGSTGAVNYGQSSQLSTQGSHWFIKGTASNGIPDITVDLSAATAATINQLRQAWQLQRLFERDARGGTRYVEILLSHFGVVSPDFRLQRPEYLGGGSTDINVSPVPQTSDTGAGTPQGNLAAFAMGAGTHGFNHSFSEHGHVIGFISVRAFNTYQQGMHRMWSRQTRYDFYWPTLAHLGEQAVLNKEIYCDGSSNDEAVFGYQERFAEYRYRPSMVTHAFRSNYTGTLDKWHLAMKFAALPTLASILPEAPPVTRIVAVTTEPKFRLDSFTQLRHARRMPTYSIPGMVDHF